MKLNEEVGQEAAGSEEQAPQISPIEQKALDMGWRPKEDFEGNEEDFIDAKEFVHRQPLFDKIAQQNKHIKATQAALEALKQHHTKVKESEYQRALTDLKAQQKAALQDGDVDKFYAMDEQIESIQEEKNAFVAEQQAIQVEAPQVHPELESWMGQNPWYSSKPHMRLFADDVGARFKGAVMAKTMTPQEVLREVEKAVRQEFPNQFRNPNKDKPSAVEGSSGKRVSKGPEMELTDMERTIMNNLVKTGVLTKAQYLAELGKTKDR